MNATTSSTASVTVGSVMRTIPMMLVSLVAIGGNFLVLVSVARTKSLHRVPGNLFVVNLAVTDVLAGVLSMPISYTTVLLNGRWIFGSFLCRAGGILAVCLSLVTILTLTGFSLYRFDAVTSQRRRPNSELWRLAKFSIAAAWLAGIFLSFPPLVGWGRFEFIPGVFTCTINWGNSISYSLTLILVGYVIPQTLIMSSYLKIIRFLKAHNKRMTQASKKRHLNSRGPRASETPTPEPNSLHSEAAVVSIEKEMASDFKSRVMPGTPSVIYVKAVAPKLEDHNTSELIVPISDVSRTSSITSFGSVSCDGKLPPRKDWAPDSVNATHNSDRRVHADQSSNAGKRIQRQAKLTRVLITTVVAFMICWLPLAVGSVLSAFGYTGAQVPYLELVAVWLAYSNAVCNPLIYALLNKQFRTAFRDTLAALSKPRHCC